MILASRRRTRLLVAGAALALALVATSCSSDVDPAAVTVNGTDVDGGEFADTLQLYVDNEAYVAAAATRGEPVEGDLAGSASTQLAARLLADEIFFVLVKDEFDARGLQVSPGNADLAATLFAPRFLGGQDAFDAFPQSFKDRYVAKVAEYITLQSSFADIDDLKAAAERALTEDPAAYERRCASHILVETEEEAEAVVEELDGGADFAQLAQERSIDTGSGAQGGFLACLSAADASAQYVPEFADAVNAATVGEVTQPVQSQFGYHVILVDRTEPGDLEVAMQNLLEPAGPAYTEWLRETFGSADIEVNPRYGTWNPATNSVQPPAGAAVPGAQPTTTLAPATTAAG